MEALHFGFNNELVTISPDRAFGSELVESLPNRQGSRAVDPCFEVEVHLYSFLR
jgi:hypothetical protein